MADYWKSQAKKFCDFCKCWIADNKPSVEFHEKGKRHKENVQQRLGEIRKKSTKEFKEQVKVDEQIRKMEEAAMKAYMKDLETNDDLTSKMLKEQLAAAAESAKQPVDVKEGNEAKVPKADHKAVESSSNTEEKIWHEAKSDEGYTYYWNSVTGESKWEPPDEGFLSLSDQEKINKPSETSEVKHENEEENDDDETKEVESEEEPAQAEEEEEEEIPETVIGPAPRSDPYGAWQAVETRSTERVDLQLPEQEYIEIRLPSASEEPQFKFKEKKVKGLESFGSGETTSFKKRKVPSGHKRNMRKRLDDD